MDLHRYRRLHAALSLSVFVGYVTSRYSGTAMSGVSAFFAVLIFSSLILFIVGSSSAQEAIAANLTFFNRLRLAPGMSRRVLRRELSVRLPAVTVALPFRFQLPPPISSF